MNMLKKLNLTVKEDTAGNQSAAEMFLEKSGFILLRINNRPTWIHQQLDIGLRFEHNNIHPTVIMFEDDTKQN